MKKFLGLLLGLILLHRPDGVEVWFKAEEINYVAPADKIRNGPMAGSIILIHDTWLAVLEPVAVVVAKVGAAQ